MSALDDALIAGIEDLPLLRVPAELRERAQWVLWRHEDRPKPTKVPYMANAPDRHASVDEPATWAAFEDALALAGGGPGGDGIGYVFSDDDPYTGVDLDDCLTDDGDLHPAAAAIVLALDSYTEWSPRGKGLHIIMAARLKKGARHSTKKTPWGGKFEVYSTKRFFSMTGRVLRGAPGTIEPRQAELDATVARLLPPPAAAKPSPRPAVSVALEDEELLRRAAAARNGAGADFERLWAGDFAGRDSHSEADLALCKALAFWTGPDPHRIDSLFRRSGLRREKWDSRRGETTYGAQTIARALEGKTDFFHGGRDFEDEPPVEALAPDFWPNEQDVDAGYPPEPPPVPLVTPSESPFRLEPIDWRAILKAGVPKLEYLSEPHLPARKRIWGVGAAESGKSIWAAYKATELTRAGLVVAYISQENGLEEEARRFLRLRPDFSKLRLAVDQGLDLTEPDHFSALVEFSHGAVLCVLDTLSACWSGDEDSNKELAAFDRDVLKPLIAETGASPFVLDHTGNPQAFVRRRGVAAPRGASAKGQKTDFLLEFRAAGACEFKIEHGKARGTKKSPAQAFRVLDIEDDGLEVVPIETSDDEKAVALADELVEAISAAGMMITKKLRAAAKDLGAGAEVQTAAMDLLRAEDPPRVSVGWETVDTDGGRQRAKVWRPAPTHSSEGSP